MVEAESVANLLDLNDFSEEAILQTVMKRFQEGLIFTAIGSPILISVNPYERLPIFTVAEAQKVRNYSMLVRGKGKRDRSSHVEDPGPHLFMVAENAYQ